MKLTKPLFFALMFSLFVSQAQAATILLNIPFGGVDTGLSAIGQFDYDPVTDKFSNINIVSEAGKISGATYIAASPDNILSQTIDFISSTDADLTGARRILFNLSGGTLDDLVAGTVASLAVVGPAGDIVCSNSACTNLSAVRGLSGNGFLTLAPEVPIPAALPLFIAGLGSLGMVQRRRKHGRC